MAEIDFGPANVDAIAYNFDTWLTAAKPDGTPVLEGYAAKGRVLVAEPSTEQVVRFWSDWMAAQERAWAAGRKIVDARPEPDATETDEQRDEREIAETAAAQLAAVAFRAERRKILSAVCSGTPSEAELEALPFRVCRFFEGYVTGKLGPEA